MRGLGHSWQDPAGIGEDVGGTSKVTIRPAYSLWPLYNRRLCDVVAAMSDEQLALRPSPERWPIWATVGHTACQRVFWLCDFAGEPGAETTPFTDAAHTCPGDEDLDHPLSAGGLVEALDSSFRIVEGCLDRWTVDMLADELRREDYGEGWVHTRGAVIQRVFSHDVYHCAELNEVLGIAGLAQIDLWD
ncbi:MAG: DinB family protein [Candidatus Limnocylindrales bacterium]